MRADEMEYSQRIAFIAEFAKLCGQMEGWKPGSPAWVNNNPLNLDAPTPRSTGRDDKGRAMFKTVSDGWLDAETYISSHIAAHDDDQAPLAPLTLQTFFAGQRDAAGKVLPGGYHGFAPLGDSRGVNQPNTYALFLAHGLQLNLDEPLAPYLAGAPWPKLKAAGSAPTTAQPATT